MAYPAQHTHYSEVISNYFEKVDPRDLLTPVEGAENFAWDDENDTRFDEYVIGLQHGEAVFDEESENILDGTVTPVELDSLLGLDFISSDDVVGLYLKEMSRVPLLSVETQPGLSWKNVKVMDRLKYCMIWTTGFRTEL